MPASDLSLLKRFFRKVAVALGWTRSSYYLMGAFVLTVLVIIVVWWPLAQEAMAYIPWNGRWWAYIDWLLLGDFAVMSLLIMAGADLKSDALIIIVGLAGGLVIESWGTQTNLWHYYTQERPPLWIIPAWPIASLSIDRLVRLLDRFVPQWQEKVFQAAYWLILPAFYALMLVFVWPTIDKSLTLAALTLSGLLIVTPTNHRTAVLTFIAGSGLGYFLELWGTTRYCWIYYTGQTPPFFAVLAHGMAALAFWRVGRLMRVLYRAWVAPRFEGIEVFRTSGVEEGK